MLIVRVSAAIILVNLLDFNYRGLRSAQADFLPVHLDGNGIAKGSDSRDSHTVSRQKPQRSETSGIGAVRCNSHDLKGTFMVDFSERFQLFSI